MFLSQYRDAALLACRKNMFFQAVGLDSPDFVVIYVLINFIYYDKIRTADMVKKELLDRAMRQFISEQVMTLSQLETLLSCSQRSVQIPFQMGWPS